MLIQTKMFIAFFMIFILASCNDGNLSDNALSNKVLREHHITNGTIAHVDEHNIMVLTLEHKESEAHDNDLDMIGSDCYLFKPTKDLNSAVIDIDDMTHIGHLSIERLSSGEIVTFFTSDNASIFTFKSNEAYEYCVVHSGVAQENQTLFIRFEALQNKRVTRADQEAVNTLKLKKDCPGCDLDGADLSHLDLSGLDLSGAKMKDVNLYGADLTKADLNGTRIRGKADISHAAFNYTDINYENFSFSSIEGASFVGASFPQQDSGKYIFDPSIAYTDVDFTKANLSNLRMQEVKFTNCIFEDATFYNSSLYNSHFISSNMRNANFEGALIDSRTSFKNSNLIDVDIEILENSNANLKESIVTEKGDSKYLVRYEDFGMIKFYNNFECRGSNTTLNSNKDYHLNCKQSSLCHDDNIQSILFYPRTRENIAIRLYDDQDGQIDFLTGTEDYTTIYRNTKEIKTPFCVNGLEHDTSSKESAQGFHVNYHEATGPHEDGLNNHVSHIKLVDEDDL